MFVQHMKSDKQVVWSKGNTQGNIIVPRATFLSPACTPTGQTTTPHITTQSSHEYVYHLYRTLEDKYWMKCTLNIDVDVLKRERPIPYKYVIHSPNREDSHPYELLQNQRGNPNRCLVVPSKNGAPQSMYARRTQHFICLFMCIRICLCFYAINPGLIV